MTSQNLWYYAQSGVKHGPVPFNDLHVLWTKAQLQPDDLVWSPGMEEWSAASSVAEFDARLTPKAPVPAHKDVAPPRVAPPPQYLL